MISKITFIGAGAMAEAFISGITKEGFVKAEQITVTNNQNQARLDLLQERYGVQCTRNKQESITGADIIILMVKPYDIKSAIESIKENTKSDQLILSVAAGITTAYITELFEQDIAVVRAMPNTSAMIGASATAMTKGDHATEEDLRLCQELLQTIGTAVVVDEEKMDAVTGLSGSGPAYVYYLVEALEKAAGELGLDPVVAKSLITQTIIGAGDMLKSSGESAEQLRKNVTSPAGTTEAGIQTLMKYNFAEAVRACVKSATDRSVELGKKL